MTEQFMTTETQLRREVIRLKKVITVLIDAGPDDALTNALRSIMGSYPTSGWVWEEENVFNENRLYEALGKDDARTVLSIWRRFKEICELLPNG